MAFCDNVEGTFDATKCACYIEYLPDEDQFTNDPSDEEEDESATPFDEDGNLPWEESEEPSGEISDPKREWESL